jgi:hypothetical protein
MFIAVFVRRLRPGKTYDDFLKAWYPDKGFGFPARVTTARNIADDREILTVGVMDADLPGEGLGEEMARVGPQEGVRHTRLDDVVESTTLRAFYEVEGDYDFTTNETVARGHP